MKKQGFAVMIGVAIVAIVALVGIGFAAFSTNLTIDGAGTVKASSWKIKFADLASAELTGTAKETTAPTISNNDTHIGDYDVTFSTPGDSVTYKFDVVNNGTFDAKITSLVVPTPSCTGSGENATTDANKVSKYLSYTLTYDDSTPVAENDTLAKGETKHLVLTLSYSADVTVSELPTNDVTISNLGITLLYSQK